MGGGGGNCFIFLGKQLSSLRARGGVQVVVAMKSGSGSNRRQVAAFANPHSPSPQCI